MVDLRGSLDQAAQYAHWPLRLAFAAVFLFHGFEKLTGGPAAFGESVGGGAGVGWMVTFAELSAGFGILYGGLPAPGAPLVTRLAGLAPMPVMVGAIHLAHWPQWRFFVGGGENLELGGMQFQVLMIGLGLWFAITAGRFDASKAPAPIEGAPA